MNEYLKEDQRACIDDYARKSHAALGKIEALVAEAHVADPFSFLLELKRAPMIDF